MLHFHENCSLRLHEVGSAKPSSFSLRTPRNEYFLYALLLGYASARPRQSERAEQAFRKAYAKGIEANKHAAQQQEVGDTLYPYSLMCPC